MSPRKIVPFALAACLVLGPVGLSIAQDAAALVKERQDLMKADGGLLKKASGETGAEAAATLQQLHDNFGKFPALFPEGSVTDQSEALPAIWQNKDAFDALFAKAQQATKTAIAAAQAGDSAAHQASIKGIMGVCGECHQDYRLKKM